MESWNETFECCDTQGSVWWQVRLHLIPRHLAPPPSTHTQLTLKIAKSKVGFKVRFYTLAHLSHSTDELQWCIFLPLGSTPIHPHSVNFNLQNDEIHLRFGLMRQNFSFTKTLDGPSTVLSLDCIWVSLTWCTAVLSTWRPSNLQTPSMWYHWISA